MTKIKKLISVVTIAFCAVTSTVFAQTPDERREALSFIIPDHPGQLGALAPENLAMDRPAPGFDITGTWFPDMRFSNFMFGPNYPEFIGQANWILKKAKGRELKDSITAMPLVRASLLVFLC